MKSNIKETVKKGYGKIARENTSCCGPLAECCGTASAEGISRRIGYQDEELRSIPEGADLGLGCGNPVALASLKSGDTVLDLGSGAGVDCFLAANKVGPSGRVIGVDMTPEMIEKARENARKSGYDNVEFRLAEIEQLPVDDSSIDIVISNCVINLSPEKGKVFHEAFRVLKPGGRLMIFDLVLLKSLPDKIMASVEAYIGCLSGAIMKGDYLNLIREAGFKDVEVVNESKFPVDLMANDPTVRKVIGHLHITDKDIKDSVDAVASIKVKAVKS